MYLLIDILLLLGLIVISNILHKAVPFVPIPIFQIALGIIAAVVFGVSITLDYKLFMVLFIAPMLFAGGKSIPGSGVWKHKRQIFVLAFLQVLATALLGGLLIHVFIPDMPYAVCFAFAAVLSPTDHSVISSVSKRVNLPKSMNLITGVESEINDAIGVILFNFALAAALADTFTVGTALINLVYAVIGGVLVGLALMFVILYVTEKLKDLGIADARFYTLIQLMSPFVIYYTSSQLGMSGAAAALSAGILYAFNRKRKKRVSVHDANITIVANGAWSTLHFVLTGLIYLFLGLSLPEEMGKAMNSEHLTTVSLIGYSLLVIGILAVERFVFSFIALRKKDGHRLYNAVLLWLCGARGAVTLAACLSIPFLLNDGTPFPHRDLIIFMGCAVILVTLLLSSFVLPLVAPKPKRAESNEDAAKEANRRIINDVIERLKKEKNIINKRAIDPVITYYENLLNDKPDGHEPDSEVSKAKILLIGCAAEKEKLEQLRESGKHDAVVIKHVDESITIMEKRLRGKHLPFAGIRGSLRDFFVQETKVDHIKVSRVKIVTISAAMKAIRANITPENETISHKALSYYTSILEGLMQAHNGEAGSVYADMKKGFEHMAIQIQKSAVQKMLERGEISYRTAGELRHYIRFAELALLTEDVK